MYVSTQRYILYASSRLRHNALTLTLQQLGSVSLSPSSFSSALSARVCTTRLGCLARSNHDNNRQQHIFVMVLHQYSESSKEEKGMHACG
jgi:vacuolar-type H+-ATPase subunit B/Vma2